MRWVVGVVGIALLAIVLWDAFETIILPRRISGRFRLAKLFYRATWPPWRAVAPPLPRRPGGAVLRFYGPLPLIPIGRGACRGRGEVSVGAVSLKKKKNQV